MHVPLPQRIPSGDFNPESDLEIRLVHVKADASRNALGELIYEESDLPMLGYDEFWVEAADLLLPENRQGYAQLLDEFLTHIRIPAVEHPSMIDQIFLVADAETADIPGPPIYRLLTVAVAPLLELLKVPSLLLIWNVLQKLRLDCLEDATRRERCAICRDCLDDQGIDSHDQQLMVTRLPCLHLYHGDCIGSWLETSHLCPLCRYPMPTIEEEMPTATEEEVPEASEPSQPPSLGLDWPMLLSVHSWYINYHAALQIA